MSLSGSTVSVTSRTSVPLRSVCSSLIWADDTGTRAGAPREDERHKPGMPQQVGLGDFAAAALGKDEVVDCPSDSTAARRACRRSPRRHSRRRVGRSRPYPTGSAPAAYRPPARRFVVCGGRGSEPPPRQRPGTTSRSPRGTRCGETAARPGPRRLDVGNQWSGCSTSKTVRQKIDLTPHNGPPHCRATGPYKPPALRPRLSNVHPRRSKTAGVKPAA